MAGLQGFRRLFVLVVLTMLAAVIVPTATASANGCDLNMTVSTAAELANAINCYNSQTPPGDYTITLTDNIEITVTDDMRIDSSTDSGNLTIDGASYEISGDGFASGGGSGDYQMEIDNPGTGIVYIKKITFTGAADDAIEIADGEVGIRDASFTDNPYGLDIEGGKVSIWNSTFTDNEFEGVDVEGVAEVLIRNSSFTDNYGGIGVDDYASSIQIWDSVFTNNTLRAIEKTGGGGTLSVTNSDISGTGDGVYIDNDSGNPVELKISDSTFIGSDDAGVELYGDVDAEIRNSTFTDNDWGVYADSYYAGSLLKVDIWSSTITGNSYGVEVETSSEGPGLKVSSSIVAGNSTTDCDGDIDDGGSNFDSDGTCVGFAELTTGSLGVLADNGCVTQTPDGCAQTIELLADSNAIDAGSCTLLLADQRGFTRSGSCDAGAYEYGAEHPGPKIAYTGPFTVIPEPADGLYGFGSPSPVAAEPLTESAADGGVAGLAHTGSTTTVLAQLAVALIGAGALLAPLGRRRK